MFKLNLKDAFHFTLVLLAASWGPVANAAARPNIIFILSDDHAVRAVSAYGDSLVATPNIDRIAAGGIRFDRAYVGNAICGPSRATLLTGLHSPQKMELQARIGGGNLHIGYDKHCLVLSLVQRYKADYQPPRGTGDPESAELPLSPRLQRHGLGRSRQTDRRPTDSR